MTPKEFLVRWLMDFGTEWVHISKLWKCKWYQAEPIRVDPGVRTNINKEIGNAGTVIEVGNVGDGHTKFRLTEAGLKYIASNEDNIKES